MNGPSNFDLKMKKRWWNDHISLNTTNDKSLLVVLQTYLKIEIFDFPLVWETNHLPETSIQANSFGYLEDSFYILTTTYNFVVSIVPTDGLVLYSPSGRTSYHKISRSLEAARFMFRFFQSLGHLIGNLAVVLPRCLSNIRAMRTL